MLLLDEVKRFNGLEYELKEDIESLQYKTKILENEKTASQQQF